VSENGRLNDELNYFSHIQKSLQNNSHDYDPKHFTDKGKDPKLLQIPEDEVASTVYQVLIQTADHASGNSNLLTKDGLLQHVKLITEIKNLRVQKFGS
jgi:hypothetical protein